MKHSMLAFTVMVSLMAQATLLWGKEPSLKILFIGNSLTSVHDLPRTLKQFTDGSGAHYQITTQAITPNGVLLKDHWNNQNTRSAILDGKPDVVVLQGQSVEPVYEPDFSSSMESALKPMPTKLVPGRYCWAHGRGQLTILFTLQ